MFDEKYYRVISHETNPHAVRVWHAGCDERTTIIGAAPGEGVSLAALRMWAEEHERDRHMSVTRPYPIPDQVPDS